MVQSRIIKGLRNSYENITTLSRKKSNRDKILPSLGKFLFLKKVYFTLEIYHFYSHIYAYDCFSLKSRNEIR